MKLRHAIALALAGWYLMLPPTQEMLDSACQAGNVTQGLRDASIVQCDLESLQLDTSAPLSKWESGGVFDTLAECHAEQVQPIADEEKKDWEGEPRLAFDDDLKNRAEAARLLPNDFIQLAVKTRALAIKLSQCVASNDPRRAK
jgi:hypothetical protein